MRSRATQKRRRVFVAAFAVPAALLLYALVSIIGAIRQDDLDRSLLAAISTDGTPTAVALLNAGANANARRSAAPPRTILQILQDTLRGRQRILPSADGPSALSIAVCRNNVEAVRALLAHGATGVNELVNIVGFDSEPLSEPLLFCAVQHGDLGIAAALLDHGAPMRGPAGARPGVLTFAFGPLDGCDPTAAPAHYRRKLLAVRESVKLLLARGAGVNAFGSDGETALDLAARSDDPWLVDFLLARGAAPNRGTAHEGALNCALENGDIPMAQMLLRHGASIHTEALHHEPATISASGSRTLEFALKHGASVDEVKVFGKRDGETLLELDAIGGDLREMRLLMRYGANADFRDANGETPLMRAAEYSNPATLRLLLDHGARVNVHPTGGDTMRWSALMFAAAEGNDENVDCLLQHGANTEFVDEEGETALMLAVLNGNDAAVQDLLEGGAKIDAIDKHGQTALDYADGNTPVIALLKRWGARAGHARAGAGQEPEYTRY
ncbi:MAG TPA: ankyrin repeat domain-containing protein [Chthonomonadaceae bacterium]|nr:ankyrin repeat domain-containing protein [Chthonomonadaceae bacterium]